MRNREVADVLYLIADLLEVQGEMVYKILAYRKAADNILSQGREIEAIWKERKLTSIPGVGKAIAEKVDELLSTGRLEYLEKLKAEIPPSLVEVLQVPDLGPKRAALFWKELGISNLEELEAAARAGKLRHLPGMGQKSEAKVIAGIEMVARRTTRVPLGRAWPFAQILLERLREFDGVAKAEAGGSLRRMRDTVGDLDLLAAAEKSRPVMDFFTSQNEVLDVHARGETKASVEFVRDLRAQLWVHPPERFGTALVYGTGSKDHNIRLRELAQKKGLSLSDQSFLRPDGSEILCATEEDVYAVLGLPWIPPELREDQGEIEAALAGNLPDLIQLEDLKAELHAHTTWSDGKLTVLEMAQAALDRGMRVLAITDHSESLGVAGGLSVERLREQRKDIDVVQDALGDSILLLQGTEVEIRSDGSLDYPDDVLESLDIVIASLHSSLRQPKEQVTERALKSIRNPHVDILGHPTGRMIPSREGADLDMEAVLSAAAEYGVALEINAHPARLDLNDLYARRAVQIGALLTINTDAHTVPDLDLVRFGVATARRAWVEPKSVINTWDREDLLSWLKTRTTR